MTDVHDWFDSPLYDALYAHRDDDEARRLAAWISALFPPSAHPTLLDLACGRGRHSLNLAKLGYVVTGLDLSPRAVRIAESRASAAGLDIRFIHGDMRIPLEESFDGVVNLFTSFGYAVSHADNRTVLASMRTMLKPGGFFVIDYLNADWVAATLVPAESGQTGDIRYTVRRWIDNGMVFKDITVRHPDGTKEVFREQVRLYGLDWFVRELEAVGLSIDILAGDYDGSAFDARQSPRLIIASSL